MINVVVLPIASVVRGFLAAAPAVVEGGPKARDRLTVNLSLSGVDDAQELTTPAARLLEVIHAPHIDIVLIVDPDAAVQTFRGADPRLLGADYSRFGDGPTITLATSYRQPQVLRSVARRVTRRIGAVGGGVHRELEPARAGGRVDVRLLRATSQEAGLIAAELRQAHLLDHVPWSEMAVIVRGQGRTSTLRRVLMAAGVPVAVPSTEVAVRDEVAVRPLLALLEVALNVATGKADPIDAQTAADMVLSPSGAADAVGLVRLRRALRRDELDSEGRGHRDEHLPGALRATTRCGRPGPVGAARAELCGPGGMRGAGRRRRPGGRRRRRDLGRYARRGDPRPAPGVPG